MKNARAILGVSEFATKEEIKQAYFKRLRIVHPDRFDPGSADWQNAGAMLRELNEAYSSLKNLPQGARGKDNKEYYEDDGYENDSEAGDAAGPKSNGGTKRKSKFMTRCGWAYRWGLFALALACALLLTRKAPIYAAVGLFFIPSNLCDCLFGWKRVARIWDLGQRVVLILLPALCLWQVVSPSPRSPLALFTPDEPAKREGPSLASLAFGNSRPDELEGGTAFDEERQPQPELPVPQSGTYWNFTGLDEVAPLTVKTSGTGYYIVKLAAPQAQTTAMEFFIHAGDTIEFEVPLGVYRMRYASGEKWYGKDGLFGPDTTYTQSDTVFSFDIQDNRVNGYTVTLHEAPGENMQTHRILNEDLGTPPPDPKNSQGDGLPLVPVVKSQY